MPERLNAIDALPPANPLLFVQEIALDRRVKRGARWYERMCKEQSHRFSLAVACNMMRNGLQERPATNGIALGLMASSAVLGWPLLALATGLMAGHAVLEVYRARGGTRTPSRRCLPPGSSSQPVFRNASLGIPEPIKGRYVWAHSAWRLKRIVDGYNARARAINGLVARKFATSYQLQSAQALADLMREHDIFIFRIEEALESAYREHRGSMKALAHLDEELGACDLFGDDSGSEAMRKDPDHARYLDWLILDAPITLGEQVMARYEQDKALIEAHERRSAVDLENRFDDLERAETMRTTTPDLLVQQPDPGCKTGSDD